MSVCKDSKENLEQYHKKFDAAQERVWCLIQSERWKYPYFVGPCPFLFSGFSYLHLESSSLYYFVKRAWSFLDSREVQALWNQVIFLTLELKTETFCEVLNFKVTRARAATTMTDKINFHSNNISKGRLKSCRKHSTNLPFQSQNSKGWWNRRKRRGSGTR